MTYVTRTKDAAVIVRELMRMEQLLVTEACRPSAVKAAARALGKEFTKLAVVALDVPAEFDLDRYMSAIPDPAGGWIKLALSPDSGQVIICTTSLEAVSWFCRVTGATPATGSPVDANKILYPLFGKPELM